MNTVIICFRLINDINIPLGTIIGYPTDKTNMATVCRS